MRPPKGIRCPPCYECICPYYCIFREEFKGCIFFISQKSGVSSYISGCLSGFAL